VVRPALKASVAGQAIATATKHTLGYTFWNIAERASISISTVKRFFAGKLVSPENFYSICQVLKLTPEEIIYTPKEGAESNDILEMGGDIYIGDILRRENTLRVERSIEFPPEYWEAGTSILSYFSRVLRVKYPSQKIKVRIEQEGLRLRMIIDTPTGEKEKIERTLEEYGLVVTGKILPESFFSDPFEAMALKNKLEIADLELRQAKKLLDFTQDNSQQRIESLEVQVNKLHSIIENGLQSGNHVFGVIRKMSEQDKSRYDLSNAKFGGGFAAEGGFQVGGNLIDLSSARNLSDAAQQIQELLQQLEGQGVSIENVKQQAASDIAKQAEANPNVREKLIKWGQSLADTAGKTTVSEAVKGVLKLAAQMSGIPLP